MIVNALLVRWADGYFEINDAVSIAANGRHEIMLSLSDTRSIEEATRIAEATLDEHARVRVAVEASLLPLDDSELPYEGFDVGDTVTVDGPDDAPATSRVKAISVSEDAEGAIVWTPELGDIIDEPGQRQTRWLNRMVNGTIVGKSESAQPLTAPVTSAPQDTLSEPVSSGAAVGTDVYDGGTLTRGNPGTGIGESVDAWVGPQASYRDGNYADQTVMWTEGAGTYVTHFDGDGKIHVVTESGAGWFVAQLFCKIAVGAATLPRAGFIFLAPGGGPGGEFHLVQAATNSYMAVSTVYIGLGTGEAFDVDLYYASVSGASTATFSDIELHLTRLSTSIAAAL